MILPNFILALSRIYALFVYTFEITMDSPSLGDFVAAPKHHAKIKLGRESFSAYTLTILFITKEIETYAG